MFGALLMLVLMFMLCVAAVFTSLFMLIMLTSLVKTS